MCVRCTYVRTCTCMCMRFVKFLFFSRCFFSSVQQQPRSNSFVHISYIQTYIQPYGYFILCWLRFSCVLEQWKLCRKKNTCKQANTHSHTHAAESEQGWEWASRQKIGYKNANGTRSKNEIKQIILNVLFFTLFTKPYATNRYRKQT